MDELFGVSQIMAARSKRKVYKRPESVSEEERVIHYEGKQFLKDWAETFHFLWVLLINVRNSEIEQIAQFGGEKESLFTVKGSAVVKIDFLLIEEVRKLLSEV